jgi:hypothetical protein
VAPTRRENREESQDDSEEFDEPESINMVSERVKDFETRLKVHPEDTAVWIAYSRAHVSNEQGGNSLAHLEISLSILARALEIVHFNKSVPLHLEYLRVAAEIWPSSRVEHAWSSLLDRVEQNIQGLSMSQGIFDLWVGHIGWSEGPGFGQDGRDVDFVVELYEQRLAMVPAYGKSTVLCFDCATCTDLQRRNNMCASKGNCISLEECAISWRGQDTKNERRQHFRH